MYIVNVIETNYTDSGAFELFFEDDEVKEMLKFIENIISRGTDTLKFEIVFTPR